MEAITQGNGCYWKTDDLAGLSFNEVDRGDSPPTTIKAFHMGSTLVHPEWVWVEIDTMEFLCAGLFGEGRTCGWNSTTKWTGASHKFSVYSCSRGFSRKEIVILVAHGGGMRGYFFEKAWSRDMWMNLRDKLSPEQVWDLCHELVDAYDAGRLAEKGYWTSAIVEKRVRVRRKGGHARLEVA